MRSLGIRLMGGDETSETVVAGEEITGDTAAANEESTREAAAAGKEIMGKMQWLAKC